MSGRSVRAICRGAHPQRFPRSATVGTAHAGCRGDVFHVKHAAHRRGPICSLATARSSLLSEAKPAECAERWATLCGATERGGLIQLACHSRLPRGRFRSSHAEANENVSRETFRSPQRVSAEAHRRSSLGTDVMKGAPGRHSRAMNPAARETCAR